jgi:hypothetical protein
MKENIVCSHLPTEFATQIAICVINTETNALYYDLLVIENKEKILKSIIPCDKWNEA